MATFMSTKVQVHPHYLFLGKAMAENLDNFSLDFTGKQIKQSCLDLAIIFFSKAMTPSLTVVRDPKKNLAHPYQVCVNTLDRMGKLANIKFISDELHRSSAIKKLIAEYLVEIFQIKHRITCDQPREINKEYVANLIAFFFSLTVVEQKRMLEQFAHT